MMDEYQQVEAPWEAPQQPADASPSLLTFVAIVAVATVLLVAGIIRLIRKYL